jgi:arginine-tRNA-protein transferase
MEHRLLLDVEPAEWEDLLSRGWRRFGPLVFRPACASCGECVSLRLSAAAFRPTTSQRRARKAIGRFRAETGPATWAPEKLELYTRWHRAREEKRGWDPSPLDRESYSLQFAWPHPCARELRLYDGERLVLVGLYDRTPRALSALFCFYDPDIARFSPGVGNVVWLLEHARAEGLEHVYLGYRVLGYPSLAYKARYGPHQLLDGRPGPAGAPAWA